MRGFRWYSIAGLSAAVWVSSLTFSLSAQDGKTIDLPTSKQLTTPVPGDPKRLNTLPMSIAVSPDKRYVVTLNAGYGTFESNYDQSLAVLDTQTGVVVDFPDSQTQARVAKQTMYSGLAFSKDGKHLYASMASTTDPLGQKDGDTGSGVAVYGFSDGKITRERMIKIPLQQLAPGHRTKILGGKGKAGDGDKGVPFPAAIAVIGGAGAEKLLVADNLSDDVLLLDAATGAVLQRFDLAETNNVPSVYPVALAVSKDEARAYVALWNASEVVELNLKTNTVGRKLELLKPKSPIAPGTHPCALDITADGKTMYVALSNRDAVAAIDLSGTGFRVKGYFDTRLPGQTYFGAEPAALAVSEDGRRLYVANMGSDALAVIDTAKLTKGVAAKGFAEPVGFVPTEWMPMNVAFTGGKVYVATAKGKGTGPNNFPQRQTDAMVKMKSPKYPSTYIATLLYGSIATLNAGGIESGLKASTAQVLESNRMRAAEEKIKFADGSDNRIKHVIYIIKENRTYDQILGDLSKDGKPVGNGDASLTMYGEDITPNEHALALRFGVLDNFFDSGEVSGDGHVWSNAAIGTDYLEKTWEQDYRGGERGYDFEGVVSSGYPLLQNIPDVNEPASGYLWTNLAKHNKTLYHFGEYISSVFCDEKHTANPQDGPMLEGEPCKDPEIKPGQPLPANWGGGVNLWPWAIPKMAKNLATKPELVGHFAVESPDFNLKVPDQIRVQIFEQHLKQWVADREAGHDTMPNFVMLRLANDHTAGTTPGSPTPKASVADNDLAVGRAVEMISHTKFWEDTAFFILEDDAQNGADHVDAHRSVALVVSKYSPKMADGGPFVDSRFYSTVSVIRTMETLLGIPPMNNNDALCSLINTEFTGAGDDAPYVADYRNRDNGLIYTANKKTAVGAKESMKMDFRHADRADAQKLNVVLWQDAMQGKAVPPMLMEKRKKANKDDDD
ncbi:bifunctional YncE family protein/alkaline phosphatase family protein [Granulicella aggregans]|uniref:bifunctional YncE family protein/alkaline phosphatase family protein n=1 Tax=Granulicella aggregans TaxID=474949 RepID=UPI0021DFD7E2|nr:bifunctional YncE family protein/alkaline phosphatase family protein [Granulicella aggregans]